MIDPTRGVLEPLAYIKRIDVKTMDGSKTRTFAADHYYGEDWDQSFAATTGFPLVQGQPYKVVVYADIHYHIEAAYGRGHICGTLPWLAWDEHDVPFEFTVNDAGQPIVLHDGTLAAVNQITLGDIVPPFKPVTGVAGMPASVHSNKTLTLGRFESGISHDVGGAAVPYGPIEVLPVDATALHLTRPDLGISELTKITWGFAGKPALADVVHAEYTAQSANWAGQWTMKVVEASTSNYPARTQKVLLTPPAGPYPAGLNPTVNIFIRVEHGTDLSTAYTQQFTITAYHVPTVYVAGFTGNGYGRACYWKDGVRVDLETVNSQATGIFVDGEDVYVSGYHFETGVQKGCYMKNGARFDLNGNKSAANDIVVFNGDVYVVGSYLDASNKGQACYWKNGSMLDLNFGGIVSTITVSGGDVYMAGANWANSVRCYWKNGARTEWASSSDINNNVRDIFVSGNNVYLAGQHGWPVRACYTLNGAENFLPNGFFEPQDNAFGIAVDNGDVYVVGYYKRTGSTFCASYWLNGELHTLSYATSEAKDIAISRGSVYIAGADSDTGAFGSPGNPCYWKDETLIMLDTDGYGGTTNAIFVVE
jgi:hypothetical protein